MDLLVEISSNWWHLSGGCGGGHAQSGHHGVQLARRGTNRLRKTSLTSSRPFRCPYFDKHTHGVNS